MEFQKTGVSEDRSKKENLIPFGRVNTTSHRQVIRNRNQTSQQEVQKVENNGALPQTSEKNEFQ